MLSLYFNLHYQSIRLRSASEQPMVLVQVHEVERCFNSNLDTFIISISLISRTAWEGLKKPVKTFSTDHILKCSGLCTGMPEDCDTFHYDFWHQLCSPAKVGILSSSLLHTELSLLYQQIDCIAQHHQLRDKTESEGDSPCTAQGEIGIWVFNEIK